MKFPAVNRIIIPLVLVLVIPILLGFYLGGQSPLVTVAFFIIILGIPLLAIYFGFKNIIMLTLVNIALGTVLCISLYNFGYRPDIFSQIGGMLGGVYLFVMLVVSFIAIFKFWEKYSLFSMIPFVILLLCFKAGAISLKSGHNKREKVFAERLPQYEEAVRMMESKIKGEPLSLRGKEVPEAYKHLAYCILAEKDEKGVLVVTFFWGGGFPSKHSAFVYRSDGHLPLKGTEFRREWPFAERINENWLRVGD